MTEKESSTPKNRKMRVASIIPDSKNARTHSEAQVEQIAASIKRFGFNNPILIDENNVIIAGHGRFLGAMKLGLKSLPVRVLSHMSNAEKRAYVLADNQIALNAGWDLNLVKFELLSLQVEDFDLSLTGFGEDFVADLLREETEGLTDDDDVPEAPKLPVVVLGDIWVLGNHRLMCGDSTSIDAVDSLMEGGKADMVFTDPPYGINVVGGSKSFGSVGGSKPTKVGSYSSIIGDDTTEAAEQFIQTCNALGFYNQVIWGGNYFTGFLPPRKGWVVWDKKGRKWDDSFSDFEMAWSSYDKPAKILTHVWMGVVQSGEREKRVHPTQKPTGLVVDCLDYFDKECSIIFDGFGGSGTTLIACEKTGRQCRMMELDPVYVQVILQRWADFTGKDPVREADGKAFSKIKRKKK